MQPTRGAVFVPYQVRAQSEVRHHFTVDVEEAFQVSAFEPYVERSRWDGLPSRVERNVDVLLELLNVSQSTGTFFTLGWIARRHPNLVRRIAEQGHEIASHGWWHRRVHRLTPTDFRQDVRESKALLEDLCGKKVEGFRAPSFSIVPGCEWAFDVLLDEGYRYDSSIFPVRRRGSGYPGTPRVPFLIQRPSGHLLELPLATARFPGFSVPAAGGGYLRQLPFVFIHRAFSQFTARGIPGMFYVHPWELDPDQPRIPTSLFTRLRHYRGLRTVKSRLERLLAEFRFTSVADSPHLTPRDDAQLIAAGAQA